MKKTPNPTEFSEECLEHFEDKPHFLHSETCQGFCDYACNPMGFDQAERIYYIEDMVFRALSERGEIIPETVEEVARAEERLAKNPPVMPPSLKNPKEILERIKERQQEDDYDDSEPHESCCTCGGEGMIEYMEGGPEVWGEDCPSEENHLVTCPNCRGSGLLKDCTTF